MLVNFPNTFRLGCKGMGHKCFLSNRVQDDGVDNNNDDDSNKDNHKDNHKDNYNDNHTDDHKDDHNDNHKVKKYLVCD